MRQCALGLVFVLLVAACGGVEREVALERAPMAGPGSVVDTEVSKARGSVPAPAASGPASSAPAAPATTSTPTTVPPTTTVPSAAALAAAAATQRRAWTTGPYEGFGAWLDAYDWSAQFSRSGDVAGPEAIDHMAAEGVQTLYIQASRWNSPTDILEPERLRAIIDRAHQHGIAVVGWYLPTFVDPATDLRRILAIASFGVDGIGIDIEARDVADVAERNRRLVELSRRLREELPGKAISAIVLEPVLIEDVNANYWPSFPWAEIAPYYDVWLPMSYWTNRRGHWRGAYPYTAENIVRIRERIGQPEALVHTIGGIGDKTTVPDLQQMVTAAVDQRAIGGSIYDYRTSRAEFWEPLRAFRTP